MRISNAISGGDSTPPGLPNFDSTTAFVRATARHLRGESFPALGLLHPALVPAAARANRLPRTIRTALYTASGANEGVPPADLDSIDVESFRRWVVERYPTRGYPAVLIGSSNGAAVSLAALLGIPWLPQTFLVAVRRSLGADEIRGDLAWGRRHAPALLEANPDVSLSQMHDPNQDRLMVEKLAYVRVKSHTLGEAYESFLETVLEPGGTVVTLECGYDWPTIDLGDRHTFQVGGLGGLDPAEYYEGSDRVAAFLARQGSDVREWNAPEPDGLSPEAEWGFDSALLDDLERFARKRGYDRRRLAFEDPRDLSPFVADCYRERYAERGVETDRLLVNSFVLLDPWWTLRTGSVPYWAPFNTMPDARALADYLDERAPYDECLARLFSHGIRSAGLASVDCWRSVLAGARDRHGFVGVDESAYPADVESLVRYHADLPETIDSRRALPPPMGFDVFDELAFEVDGRYDLEWTAR